MVVCLTTNSIFLNLGMEMANSSMINATLGKSSLSIFLAGKTTKKGKGKFVHINLNVSEKMAIFLMF